MSESIYPSIRGSASQNKAIPFEGSSSKFFFAFGTSKKYKIYYLYIYIYQYMQPIGGLWNLILGSLVIEFYL